MNKLLVRIIPTDEKQEQTIAKRGNLFWTREVRPANDTHIVRLIPISDDGVAYIAEHIFVDVRNIRTLDNQLVIANAVNNAIAHKKDHANDA